ncbi:flagellin [Exiguobacterium sp. BRG2]|uniref:flagellin N-terminal helical domain-containing protein n=1 Tax=Exiguobacterium sp. BRG2 TaxID=2962584 RepID=UPI0028825505|nr:flagellin [Exiguobacterium sp. BRG2]MDT0173575.1 flagellin [Exiguobacterium sp. BRG2]
MIINHNITALNTHNKLSSANAAQGKSMEKLASGLRINKAGDDAAGLAISEKMRSQVRGLDQASRNAQDGISMIQTAEGALNETHDILQRMRELSVQAANDTNNADDRTEIQKEMNQLTSEVSRIGNNTEFNTQKLLNGNKVGAASNGGTAGTLTGTATVATAIAGNAGNLVLKVDGGSNITAAITTGDTLSSIVSKINTAAGSTIASDDGTGKLKLTSGSTGTASTVNVDASSTAATLTYLGLTSGATGTGAATGGVAKDGAASLQIGANQSQQFTVTINDMRASALGIAGTASGTASGKDGGVTGASFVATSAANTLSDVSTAGETALDISDATKASAATKVLDQAIKNVSAERSRLGAYQNRLEHTTNNLKTSSENLTAAESRVRDVDMAKEMMTQTKNSILAQAAQAMLAQSNQTPQGVLQLLR